MRLQKEKIVQQAIALLDREGLEGVTLRRLAKELDVQAASLYYHLPDKEALLGQMANSILEEKFGGFDFAVVQDWESWLGQLGHTLREAMLAHREGGRVVAGAHLGDVLTRVFDYTLQVLKKAGFDDTKASTITVTVTYFTFGFVIEEQASPPLAPAPPLAPSHFSFAAYPTFVKAMGEWMKQDYGQHFDTSMRILINGVRAELASPN